MSSTLQLQITSPRNDTVWGHVSATAIPVVLPNGDVDGDWDERRSNRDGVIDFQKVDPGPAYVLLRAPGYIDKPLELVMPHDGTIAVALDRVPLTRLTAHRDGFRNTDGQRVFLAGVSGFMHYQRFLDGEDIQPLLQQAADLGANMVRVFGMAHYIPVNAGRAPFKPQDYGDRYFDQIAAFCALCESCGLYVYWSVFPDVDMIGIADKRAFLNRVVGQLRQAANTLGELTNEQDAHSFNAVDPRSVDRPTGIAFCSGSYGDIGEAQPYPWHFCDYHQPREYPKHIKDGCVVDHPNYREGWGVLLGEPDRYGTDGNGNADQARQSAGACRETALGMVFHSTQGRESLLYDDATLAIGRVFVRALIGPAEVGNR